MKYTALYCRIYCTLLSITVDCILYCTSNVRYTALYSKPYSVCAALYSNLYCTMAVVYIIFLTIYRVSQEERTKLRESVPYVKLYRYNPKHLYPKLNDYGDNGQRKVWTSCISAFYTPTVYREPPRPVGHVTACRTNVG